MKLLSRILLLLVTLGPSIAPAADFDFYGRSGDAIALDFAALPGTPAGATFSGVSLSNASGHTLLSSDSLGQGAFTSQGNAWLFANPALDQGGNGDTNPDARGFQGRLEGTVLVNGQPKSFSVTVQPGYTGAGAGAVQQSFERLGRAANNRLFVAQQQQRLRFLGFRRRGGSRVNVSGTFDTATDEALQTFQAAFDTNVNATQATAFQADGIVGPGTAGWLNAANAPTWDELIDPDPQVPGTFAVGSMIGDFDILPGSDPGGGGRTGLTPQSERFGTSWAIDLFRAGSAAAKQATGITQLMNGISTEDGYGSAVFHSTHRVGMDIDVHVDSSTWNQGNGFTNAAEQAMIDQALAFIQAPGTTGVARVLTSNRDIFNGINAVAPGVAARDFGTGHQTHLHLDVAVPQQVAGLANLPGDFNLDGSVDAADYTVWRDGLGATRSAGDLNVWRSNYGSNQTIAGAGIPEPAALGLVAGAAAVALLPRRQRR